MKTLFRLLSVIAIIAVVLTGCKKKSASDDSSSNSGGVTPSSSIPEGAINGLFSISENKQVYFSKGNLQYQGSTGKWRFAEKQWNIMNSGWFELFGWGTGDNPKNLSENNGDYPAFVEWGKHAISNGGNVGNKWRTLKIEEWKYVFWLRETESNILFAKAVVNDVDGMILLPDNWKEDYYTLNYANTYDVSYDYNVISENDWTNILEAKGAVFLPAAGMRRGETMWVGAAGNYWSSDYYDYDDAQAYSAYFSAFMVDTWHSIYRNYGFSVRLVCDAK